MFKWPLIERPTASKGTKSWFLLAISHSRSRFWQILNLQKIKISQKEQYGLAWDKTLYIIPQSYRGTFEKRTHRMYRIFSHTCDKFSTVFSDNYPFHRVIRHKAVAGGGKTYSRKLFSRLFLWLLILSLDLCTTNDLVCTKLKTEREASSRIIVPL